jgi:anti-sigma factor RsiW
MSLSSGEETGAQDNSVPSSRLHSWLADGVGVPPDGASLNLRHFALVGSFLH